MNAEIYFGCIPCLCISFRLLMKNMKVLLVTVRSDFGGGPRHVDQLINSLPPEIELYVAYPKEGDPYASLWEENKRIKGRFYLPYRTFSLRTLYSLKKFIVCNKIDVVHSHGNGAGFYSRLLKVIGAKAKIVHTFHGISNDYSSKVKRIANVFFGKSFRLLTDYFVVVSKGELELAKKSKFIKQECFSVIYNGVDSPVCNESSAFECFKVVTLSRFDFQKNMDLAYDIAKKMKDENIQFVWVGDGNDFTRLKEKALLNNLKIEFTGFSKTPMKYLQSASIYLSTSRFEGLPYALVEAASVGLPIVATNVVGNNEVVFDNVNGFLFDNANDACQEIMRLYKNNDLRIKMGMEAKRIYNDFFTIKSMIEKIVSVYNKLYS